MAKTKEIAGQMSIQDFIKPYDVNFLRFCITHKHPDEVAELKGLTREEFIQRAGGKVARINVGNLVTGQRFYVTDDVSYRPDIDHVPWDDYIAMFKEVWE